MTEKKYTVGFRVDVQLGPIRRIASKEQAPQRPARGLHIEVWTNGPSNNRSYGCRAIEVIEASDGMRSYGEPETKGELTLDAIRELVKAKIGVARQAGFALTIHIELPELRDAIKDVATGELQPPEQFHQHKVSEMTSFFPDATTLTQSAAA